MAAATGIITRVATCYGARATDFGPFPPPSNFVAVDGSGNIFTTNCSEDSTSIFSQRSVTGSATLIAGFGDSRGFSGHGGLATNVHIPGPVGAAATDAAGDVYFADTGNNAIRVLVPVSTHALLRISSAHSGNFLQGQMGATYTVVVANNALAGTASGTVVVAETVPTGLALVSMSGANWNCSGATCTRSDTLNPGASYPPITVTVNVAANAPLTVTNGVGVSGGGSIAANASDLTVIPTGPPPTPVLVSPAQGAKGALLALTLTWNAAFGATTYDVYLGTLSTPPLVSSTTGTSYASATLSPSTTYYWQIVAQNGIGSTSSAIWSFTTGLVAAPLQFVPVTPCRVADTRNPGGLFGGPTMTAGSTRSFTIPQSGCKIPATAQAYALNVTVVPSGPLQYLTLWPAGQSRPFVSTLNSFGGLVVANAAIVPAGTNGAVSVYASDQTDVVLDINGYFDSTGGTASSKFYGVDACRIADTRNPTGQFGGPFLFGGETRDFPIPLACDINLGASAYSLNVTVVPHQALGFLTTWPTGASRPFVSTLNSYTGTVVANAAIVPAGTNGSISVYVTNPSDVILDINGVFGGPPWYPNGGSSFYPVTPCRVADTRNPDGPFGGPEMEAGETRSFAIPASSCYVPSYPSAYSLNVTVVPDAALQYLTAWPEGYTQPLVSTLNSWNGAVVANAAIVAPGGGRGDQHLRDGPHARDSGYQRVFRAIGGLCHNVRIVKLLVFSDIHGDFQALERHMAAEADYYFSAGDLSSWGRGLDRCGEILARRAGRVYVLPGNHESERQNADLAARFGLIDFHGRSFEAGGFHIAGLGCSTPTPFNTPGEYSEEEMARRLTPFAGLKPLILICHCPPLGTDLDRVHKGMHAGSSSVREFIEKQRPVAFLCGHIHEAEGVRLRLGDTLSINAGRRGFLLDSDTLE